MSRRLLVALLAIVLACGCILAIWPPFLLAGPLYEVMYGWRYPKVWECGSAEITDVGPDASHHRYVVRLGAIALDRDHEKRFVLCGLPEEQLYLGLSVDLRYPRGLWDAEWEERKDVAVSVRIVDSAGQVVVAHAGPLGGGWGWSGPYEDGAFIYGDTKLEPVDGETYELQVIVTSSSSASVPPARLSVRGGGWK